MNLTGIRAGLATYSIPAAPGVLFLATVSALSGQPWPLCSLWALSERESPLARQVLLQVCGAHALDTESDVELAARLAAHHHDAWSRRLWMEAGRAFANLPRRELEAREALRALRVSGPVWDELIGALS